MPTTAKVEASAGEAGSRDERWRCPQELAGAAAAAARLSKSKPLPHPTWPGGHWDSFSVRERRAFGLKVGMRFEVKRDGAEPTGKFYRPGRQMWR
jgi:hypothetical protein